MYLRTKLIGDISMLVPFSNCSQSSGWLSSGLCALYLRKSISSNSERSQAPAVSRWMSETEDFENQCHFLASNAKSAPLKKSQSWTNILIGQLVLAYPQPITDHPKPGCATSTPPERQQHTYWAIFAKEPFQRSTNVHFTGPARQRYEQFPYFGSWKRGTGEIPQQSFRYRHHLSIRYSEGSWLSW